MENHPKPKKHHFVPETYLKAFLNGNRFFTLDVRKVQKGYNEYPRASQPGKICYYEDYYTINTTSQSDQFNLSGYDKLFVETTALQQLEGKYPIMCRNLTEKGTLTFQESVELCDFMVLLKLRNPYWLEKTLQKNKDQWIDQAMNSTNRKRLGTDFPFKHIPEEIQDSLVAELWKTYKANPNFSKELQLYGLIERHSNESGINDQYRKALIDCEWHIMVAPKSGPFFITTDNPGFAVGADSKIYNTKFAKGFFYHFPLSPRHCLVISDEFNHNGYSLRNDRSINAAYVDAGSVVRINDQALHHFSRLLIATDEWYLSQITALNKPPK